MQRSWGESVPGVFQEQQEGRLPALWTVRGQGVPTITWVLARASWALDNWISVSLALSPLPSSRGHWGRGSSLGPGGREGLLITSNAALPPLPPGPC